MTHTPKEMPNTLIGSSIVTASYGQALAGAVIDIIAAVEAGHRARLARKALRRQRRDTDAIIAGLPEELRRDLGARRRGSVSPPRRDGNRLRINLPRSRNGVR